MDDAGWRERASHAYGARQRIDAAHLVDALAVADVRVRQSAAIYLGQIRERAAVGPLLRLLDARDEPLRIIAIKSLADINDPAAGPRLLELARDPSEPLPTRTTAMVALARLRNPGAVEALSGLLGHPKRSYRRWALRQVAEIGDPRAVPALHRAAAATGLLERRRIERVIRKLESESNESPEAEASLGEKRSTRKTRTFVEDRVAHGLTRELALYERFLEDGERALVVVSASRFFRPALLIVTDRRVIFFRHPLFLGGPRIRSIDYADIHRVEARRGSEWGASEWGGSVRLFTVGGRVTFRFLHPPSVAREVADEIAQLLPDAPATSG
jgi:hypothetical protein